MSEMVGLDFNVGGNYAATMTQMIAQADVYARSSDTLIGKVGLLNIATTTLISKTTALTGANRVATAEAAAYQQKLSNIAATAAITGQNFGQLERTTMGLARQFGSINEAVQTVEALQRSGVTAEKSIASLAEAWIKLGAANGTNGSAIGSMLLTLNRTFGNTETALAKYGDSLTTLSKKYGAPVEGALNFAKALSPVAASVGISETAVLGLGTAAARLGEEGFAGANAFNKVLIDMSRSIRYGSPEIKEYASLLGMTQKSLADLFKQDPTEVLVRFTEAIGKGGPNAMRSLEALGLDATRTIRAITSLSSQGNLRQIIDDASKSYGNDATAKAAETALSGVNHQMGELQETLSQTVAQAGKPFLGWMSDVLKAANMMTGAVHDIIASDFAQAIGKWVAPLSQVASMAVTAVSALTTLGMAKQIGGAVMGAGRQFAGGAELARGGMGDVAAQAGGLAMWGGRYGAATPMGGRGAEEDRGPWLGKALGQAIRGTGNWAAQGMGVLSNQLAGPDGRPQVYSDASTQRRAEIGAAWGGFTQDKSIQTFGQAIKDSGVSIARWTKNVSESSDTASSFGKAMTRLAGQTALSGASALGGAVQGVGKVTGALGLNPWMLGIGAGVAGVSVMQNWREDQAAKDQASKAGFSDANAAANDFAAAAGLASRGLLSLAETLKTTTGDLAKSNEDITKTYQLSAAQLQGANAPGYQQAFTAGTSDPAQIARLLYSMLGANPSAAELGRAGMDVAHETNSGQTAQEALKEYAKYSQTTNPYGELLKGVPQSYDWKGRTDETVKLETGLASNVTRNVTAVTDVYGATSAMAAKNAEAAKLYGATDQNSPQAIDAASKTIAETLGIDQAYVKTSLNRGMSFSDMAKAAVAGRGLGGGSAAGVSIMNAGPGMSAPVAAAPSNVDWAKLALRTPDVSNPNYASIAATPEAIQSMKDVDKAMSLVAGTATSFSDALYGAEQKARQFGVTVDKLTPEQVAGLSPTAQAVYTYTQPGGANAANLGAAGGMTARDVRQAQGSTSMSRVSLLAALNSEPSGPRRDVLEAALSQVEASRPMEAAGQGMMTQTGEAIKAGKAARAMGPLTDPADEQRRMAIIGEEQAAYATRLNFMKQFVMASQQLEIQLGRQAEDAATARMRSNRDYYRQVSQSTADFNLQRFRAERDFTISMRRMTEDAAKAIYDPYKRIQAASVWDTQSLLSNLADQNRAITKQTSQLAQLKKAGLSQGAIDTLDLSNSANAQQVNRMVGDISSNPALIAQINAMVAQRMAATAGAVQNPNNVTYRRATEDFSKSMRDSSVSFKIAMERAALAHRTALSDMAFDLHRSSDRAYEDLARMGQEVTGSYESIAAKFLGKIANLPKTENMAKAMSVNLLAAITTASKDATAYLNTALAPYGLDAKGFAGLLHNFTTWGTGTASGSSGSTGVLRNDASAPIGDRAPATASGKAAAAINYAKRQLGKPYVDDPPGAQPENSWDCSKLTTWAYKQSGIDLTPYSYAQAQETNRVPDNQRRPGDLLFFFKGAHHVALYAGGDKYIEAASPGTGVVTSKIGNSWYRDHYSYAGRPKGMFAGGIATTPMMAELAEQGHREAVIPLNQGGAKVLAETMVRYVDQTKVQATRTQPYATSTTVTTYNYDQSTKILGPVSVTAQDPNEMARKLDAQSRRDRLVQPVGR